MIRPFRLSDTFFLQRMARHAVMLDAAQALLFPRPAALSALAAIIPWDEDKISTYVLKQQGHRLARAGFLQAQKRVGRPEADITRLAPALDRPYGHPAIWQKLLSHYFQEAAEQKIERVFADVPDQPLPVSTFAQVGFKVYSRRTIWRLTHEPTVGKWPKQEAIRLQRPEDEWALSRLYSQVTPPGVQQAEGMAPGATDNPPIFICMHDGACHSFVLEDDNDLIGCIQIKQGRQGVWINLWTDVLKTDVTPMQGLLTHALGVVRERSMPMPVYVGVSDFHGGLGSVLDELGFAPFTDRARMVKSVHQWVRDPALSFTPALERVGEAIPTQFIIPEEQRISTISSQRSAVNN